MSIVDDENAGSSPPSAAASLTRLEDMDLSPLQPIHTHQTLMMTNHFVASTLAFIDRFAQIAEAKLLRLGRYIDVLENTMALLNVKLNSIEWLNEQAFAQRNQQEGTALEKEQAYVENAHSHLPPAPVSEGKARAPPPLPQNRFQQQAPEAPPAPQVPEQKQDPVGSSDQATDVSEGASPAAPAEDQGPLLKDDPRFAKYFKMLKLGIMKEQIKMDLSMNGWDASIIDKDPNTPVSQLILAEEKKNSAIHSIVNKRRASLEPEPQEEE